MSTLDIEVALVTSFGDSAGGGDTVWCGIPNAGFTFHCAGPCNPICWVEDGLTVPYSGIINLCIGKIIRDGGDANRVIAVPTFH